MTRSRNETAELRCPSCDQAFNAEVWLVLDRQERPDLVARLLDGALNVATCPHCGAEGGINHPLLYHDAEREQLLAALPLTVHSGAAARTLVADLLESLLDRLPPEQQRPYLGEVELTPELDGLRALLIEQTLADDARVHEQLLMIAVQELLNVDSQLEFQRVIAQHRMLLLSEAAEQALEQLQAEAGRTGEHELQRRAREARALLAQLRTIVIRRRAALHSLLDELAPLTDAELVLLPRLRRMLEAIDPQEVYAARIELAPEQRDGIDRLIERLAEQAERAQQSEALAFLRSLALLPQQ